MADQMDYDKQHYSYASHLQEGPSPTLSDDLQPFNVEVNGERIMKDTMFASYGLFSKDKINNARFNKFSRIGKVLDPYNAPRNGKEYLFFVKPDLHLSIPPGVGLNDNVYNIGGYSISSINANSSGLKMNPQLGGDIYFADLLDRYPEVVKELQYSSVLVSDPFCHLLSFSVSNTLDIPGIELSTTDNPMNMFGVSYEYQKDGEASDKDISFTLEFSDTPQLYVYQFFKAWAEYQRLRKGGLITPPTLDYYKWRRQHNTMGIYKFITDESMSNIIHYSYICGVYPVSVPRDVFSDVNYGENGINLSVSFKAAFIEDMNPQIFRDFNILMGKTAPFRENPNLTADSAMKISSSVASDMKYGTLERNINMEFARAAKVVYDEDSKKYLLKWFA